MKTIEAIIAGLVIGNIVVIALLKGEIKRLDLLKVNIVTILCILAGVMISLMLVNKWILQ